VLALPSHRHQQHRHSGYWLPHHSLCRADLAAVRQRCGDTAGHPLRQGTPQRITVRRRDRAAERHGASGEPWCWSRCACV